MLGIGMSRSYTGVTGCLPLAPSRRALASGYRPLLESIACMYARSSLS